MRQQLGSRTWGELVWQQDGAGPHQASMVLDWLDSVNVGRVRVAGPQGEEGGRKE